MIFKNEFFPRGAQCVIAVTLLLVVTTSGCAEKNWGTVTGTVMVDGDPVGPGTLLWELADPDNTTARVAIAHFNAGGVYVLKSGGNREGTMAGEYRILIRGGSEEDFGDEEVDPDETSAIPARYEDYESADLTRTIQPGENRIDFELTP